MQNIIAIIWDFDKTLINGYMQDPIFKDYNVNASDFWKEVNAMPAKYMEKGVKVNPDTIYLNRFIKEANGGLFNGLSNQNLQNELKSEKFN
jgi:hypothetical protein